MPDQTPNDAPDYDAMALAARKRIGYESVESYAEYWRLKGTVSALETALAAMTEDRNLWQDAHNNDCPNLAALAEAKRELGEQAKVIRDMPWPPYIEWDEIGSFNGLVCNHGSCKGSCDADDNPIPDTHMADCPVAAFESLRLKLGKVDS